MASTAGALLGKAMVLSEEVHQAMVSRGYRGNVQVLEQTRAGWRDARFAAVMVLFAAVLLSGEQWLGR